MILYRVSERHQEGFSFGIRKKSGEFGFPGSNFQTRGEAICARDSIGGRVIAFAHKTKPLWEFRFYLTLLGEIA